MKFFTPEQANTFLDSIKGHRLEALFVMALTLGLRRGELLGLHWSDVDLDGATLRVNYGLQRFDRKLHLMESKTEKSRRVLPLPSLLVAGLRTHRTRQLEERLALGSDWQETGLVFVSTVGTPLEPRNLNRTFDALLENAKLPRIRLHRKLPRQVYSSKVETSASSRLRNKLGGSPLRASCGRSSL